MKVRLIRDIALIITGIVLTSFGYGWLSLISGAVVCAVGIFGICLTLGGAE